jgi:uncharacterized peroxidase-related enzyme
MPRIPAVDPDTATGRAKELLQTVRLKFGSTPNLCRTLAHGPAALDAYVRIHDCLAFGVLDPMVRERIALVVAEENGCEYSLAAHHANGTMHGLTDRDVDDARRARATDPAVHAVLEFARQLVVKKGRVRDTDLRELLRFGWGYGAIAEIVATVALGIFSDYFSHVARMEPDCPAIERPKAVA